MNLEEAIESIEVVPDDKYVLTQDGLNEINPFNPDWVKLLYIVPPVISEAVMVMDNSGRVFEVKLKHIGGAR